MRLPGTYELRQELDEAAIIAAAQKCVQLYAHPLTLMDEVHARVYDAAREFGGFKGWQAHQGAILEAGQEFMLLTLADWDGPADTYSLAPGRRTGYIGPDGVAYQFQENWHRAIRAWAEMPTP